jgi:hypothetical protein
MLPGRSSHKLAAFVLLALLPVSALHADTVILSAVADSGLREIAPAENSGSAPTIRIGTTGSLGSFTRNRGLFRFDPAAAIPAGASITSARLALSASKSPNLSAFGFELHRVLQPWTESAATWNLREAPDVTWSSPGGAAGVDFATQASAAAQVQGINRYTWGSTTGMVADVQGWLDNPVENYGWLLLTSNENLGQSARLFNTHESLIDRPALTVDFASPLRITSVGLNNNQLCLQFQVRAGTAYLVEARPEVNTTAWTLVTNLPPAATDGLATVCDPLAPSNRFYRVGQQ